MSDLLILTPHLGALSETFIVRHCEELAPGSTCFATFHVVRPGDAWAEDRVLTLPPVDRPRASPVEKARALLERPRHRRSYGDVWWVGSDVLSQLTSFAAEQGVQVALLEYLDRWLDAIPVLRRAGLRVVVHGHGYDMSAALRRPAVVRAYREMLPLAHAVVVPSDFAADRLRALGLDNVSVIPYGIPPGGTAVHARSDRLPVRAVAVGRMVPKKDPVGLVRAVVRARQRGSNVELDMFGDGPLRRRVELAVKALRAQSFVRLRGAQPNDAILEAFRDADVFLQRSVTAPNGDEEGLPLAILEAMASGLPVVSTFHAGIPEAVLHGHTGLLAAEHDLDGFATNITAYAVDRSLRLTHGDAAQQRFMERFTWRRNRGRLRSALHLPADGIAGSADDLRDLGGGG